MQSFFALASAFSVAVYFVYTSYVMKRVPDISSGVTLWAGHLIAALSLLPLWSFNSSFNINNIFDQSLLIPLCLATLLLVLSRELYYYAYARTDVANITVFSALTPVYTLITGYFFLGEIPSLQALAGLLLICGSIYALFLNPQKNSGIVQFILQPFKYVISSRPIFCAFLSTIPTAFAAIYQKTLLTHIDPVGLSFLMLLLIGVFALVFTICTTSLLEVKKQMLQLPAHFYVVSAVLLPIIHVLFCMVMINQQTAISIVLQRTAIAFQVILAYYFLKERQDLKKRIIVVCVVMMGFGLIMW